MPDDLVYEHFIDELFSPHPLARPILGPPKNVTGFTRDDLLRFIQSHYLPKRIVVAAAGNVNHRELVKLVKGKLDFSQKNIVHKSEQVGALKPGFHRHHRPIQQSHMVMGTRGLSYRAKDRFTLLVMNTILGSGMSSRLFQNIREKHGIAYSVYSFAEALADTGYWGVYLATDPQKVDRARKLVLNELKRLREDSVTKDELDGVRTQLKGNIMLGLENVSSRMMRLAKMEIYLDKFVSLEEVSAFIDEVTPKKIQSLANKMLVEDQLITTIVEPEAAKSKKAAKKK
jgi:predicted Zn-dependent peptidase